MARWINICLCFVVFLVNIENIDSSNAFLRIQEYLHADTSYPVLSQDSLDHLIDDLLRAFGCAKTVPQFCECLSSRPVLATLSVSDELIQKDVEKASVIILRHLVGVPNKCVQYPSYNQYGFYINWFLANFWEAQNVQHYFEERLRKILADMENSYMAHGGHGELIFTKCFDTSVVLREVAPGDLVDMAEQAAIVSVAYMLDGYKPSGMCGAHPPPIQPPPAPSNPASEEFIHSLYKHLGLVPPDEFSLHELELLMTKLDIGHPDEHEDEDEDHHAADHRRRKRSVSSRAFSASRFKRAVGVEHLGTSDIDANKCYTAEELLVVYGIPYSNHLSPRELEMVCPSLLQQQVSGVCQEHLEDDETTEVSDLEKYGFGLLAVFLITLSALIGLVFLPCYKMASFHYYMSFMIALGVGTLIGDALLHLLPQAYGLHGHSHDEDGIHVQDHIYKSLLVISAIYGFFLLESVLDMFGFGHSHSSSHSNDTVSENPGAGTQMVGVQRFRSQQNNYNYMIDGLLYSQQMPGQQVLAPNVAPNNELSEKKPLKGVKTVAWMAIFGGGVHNFANGIAIGAAFSQSVSGGISTFLAIIFHEIPHELGDFAIIMNAGMSVKRTALFNFLSGAVSFIGLFIGIALSANRDVSLWVFTIVAGMFLYIGLVNMLPELIAMQKKGSRRTAFLLQNLGFVIGLTILLLIAIYEDKIKI